jgi:hypothetical protein
MQPTTPMPFDPFALMMHPEAVLIAVAASTCLGALQRRVYRPLDRPMLVPRKGDREPAARMVPVDVRAEDTN